ncbi:keratinocyte differentiation factor 1-like [Brienomyrus brachyistius]|uniref:keratinocyte differentiation factor 1-like n=1 Tax=Brienomyrus brachyistius TaxID=42636 RepID=UPI0020B25255|nr:keratinocyte differentiation factor 1-like [Brienomyrus brachyistius]XP_048849556.1 keratinocyte differentiation factor 1-like [Brienomyrus brachyistius]XP_048849557.1 keratinocyte differentiation factor 1-like [Brienomyrus brachyistius]
MPGSSIGGSQELHPLKPPHGCDKAGQRQGTRNDSPKQYWDSRLGQNQFQERSVDPGDHETGAFLAMKSLPGNANGHRPESIDFIPGSVESLPGWEVCLPCVGPGRPRCWTVLCCLLTCGLSKICGRCARAPCLAPEASANEPTKDHLDSGLPVLQEPKAVINSSFRYPDVRLGGKKVEIQPRGSSPPQRQPSNPTRGEHLSVSRLSDYSLDSPSDGGSEDGMDIDSLIAKKLLELYTQHQIEQLARCTSDSVFLSRTSQISQLISNIQQEHDLEEQDAECRIVHGIIRLSTRKGPKNGHRGARQSETLPDSGNDTMVETIHSFDTYHDVRISEQTPSDRLARDMRMSGRKAQSSTSYASYSPSHHDSVVASSGTPLLQPFTSK